MQRVVFAIGAEVRVVDLGVPTVWRNGKPSAVDRRREAAGGAPDGELVQVHHVLQVAP